MIWRIKMQASVQSKVRVQMQPPKKESYHLTMTIRVFREWIMNGNKFFLAIANCCLITNAEQIKATLGTGYFSWLLA